MSIGEEEEGLISVCSLGTQRIYCLMGRVEPDWRGDGLTTR